jgi:transcriptional regulator with XRE-family HTH domain
MGNESSKGRADHVDQLVSKKLKMRRLMLGLSQQDLGQAVDVSIQQVQKYEKATNRISSGKLHAFSKVLKVPVSYFFDQSEESNSTLGHIFAEEGEPYEANDKDAVTEREIITLVRAFCDVRSPQSRKKIIELVKTMS